MPKLPKYTIPAPKPLSAVAQASLAADERFLRKMTAERPERCAVASVGNWWVCEYCDLLRHDGRPECRLGLAA